MDWQTLLGQLNAEYKDLGMENPPVAVYDTAGNRFDIYAIYNEDGIICIDVERSSDY